jgi:hypothetical protein
MKNSVKKQHKIGFILSSIKKYNTLPSYNTLRTVLGRFEDIVKELIDNGIIIVVKESMPFESLDIDGKKISLYTKRIYKITNPNYEFITSEKNIYNQKLIQRIGKIKKFDKITDMIINDIQNTLSTTTLNGENIDNFVSYKKGRLYSSYTNLSKSDRLALKIDGESVISIDIKSSTIQLLLKSGVINDDNLLKAIQNPTFWEDMANEFGMDKGKFKKRFLSFVNGNFFDKDLYFRFKPFFGKLLSLKSQYGYKFVNKIYMSLEKNLMFGIYQECVLNKIKFLPMHDEVIVKKGDFKFVMNLFNNRGINVTVEQSETPAESIKNNNPYMDMEKQNKNVRREMVTKKMEKRKSSMGRLEMLLANAPKLN